MFTGADFHAVNNAGVSPMVVAASRGHLEVVRTLLDKGADPNEKDGNGTSPLNAAASRKNSSVVALLKLRGALSTD